MHGMNIIASIVRFIIDIHMDMINIKMGVIVIENNCYLIAALP